MSIRLLIVEDEDTEKRLWEQEISRYNAKNGTSFVFEICDSPETAEDLLFRRKFDAAIIDIRLNSGDRPRQAGEDGNSIRKRILESEVMLVAHVTGEPGRVTEDEGVPENLVKVFQKAEEEGSGTVYAEILEWIQENKIILNTIAQSKKIIKERIASLFFSSIWPRWNNWSGEDTSCDPIFLSRSLSRHISSHLFHDLLDITNGKVHPEEWYFLPPKPQRFYTGDIINLDNALWVVITPRCDLERIKEGDIVMLSRLRDISPVWDQEKKKLDLQLEKLNAQMREAIEQDNHQQAESKEKKIADALDSFRQNFYGHRRNTPSLHFLPHIRTNQKDSQGPFFVEFNQLRPIKFNSQEYSNTLHNKIAMIAPDFLPELSQRLSSFIGRIGSPDYSHVYQGD